MNGRSHYPAQPFDVDLDYDETHRRHECPRCGQNCRKPLIRVVCPVCAAIVTVNALGGEGSTESLCSKCENTTISIMTDEFGCITDIQGWPNAIEKKAKPLDWKVVAAVASLVLFGLLMFASMFRSAPLRTEVPPAVRSQAEPVRTAPLSDERELANPSTARSDAPLAVTLKGAASPGPTALPVTQDMFAPEKK